MSKKQKIEDFRTIRNIGKGSSGSVYLVENLKDMKHYAMKVMNKQQIIEKKLTKSINTESEILSKNDNPFLLQTKCSFQTDEELYFIFEYLNGGELYHHLKQGKFSEQKSKFYAAEILTGINYLHMHNICHRDIKPENILIGSDGHIKIIDFGLSKIMRDKDEKMKRFVGTPQYMDCTIINNYQFNDKKTLYGKECDLWSFGIILFEMVLGYSPFKDFSIKSIFENIKNNDLEFPLNSKISWEAKDLIKRLLEKDPKDRISMDEIFQHPFFSGIDWNSVLDQEYIPPYIPDVKGPNDISCKYSTERMPIRDIVCNSPRRSPIKMMKTRIVDSFRFKRFEFVDLPKSSRRKSNKFNSRRKSNKFKSRRKSNKFNSRRKSKGVVHPTS